MKTNELTGAALDWAVAKCEGSDSVAACYYDEDDLPMCRDEEPYMEWQPSTNWAQGGAIIEREMIEIVPVSDALWDAYKRNQHIPNDGTTPLEAAMRCYVASKLGEEIEVPEELLDFAHE